MTRQSAAPLQHQSLSPSNRTARELVRLLVDAGDLSPAYQRGSVWNNDQRIGLIRSWLLGVPIPSIMLSNRVSSRTWPTDAGGWPEGGYELAVIDGKQRVETALMWFSGELAVPASWFPSEHIELTVNTNDGPYVTFDRLTAVGQRLFGNRATLPVVEACVGSVEEEAALYLLVNGAGTAQNDQDMANARLVVSGG
ncbi:DUF262 domain-containing protein [Leucobacter sp. cx-169]|uniref:DUF262 domain-containing protein n=1 Tax=Leucobacter sp. cx-169 TaxID=2770549 RepID=UPI00165D52E6|nr:DUF262 domain-containing protein [Leucobacter sp. cx-169]MBC9927176.1 DUF262 domain-containing protein [Leucobacter sp. cx-169]